MAAQRDSPELLSCSEVQKFAGGTLETKNSEFEPFVMERMMSKWENTVDYNLSESGVHPMTYRELLELSGRSADDVLGVEVNYPQAHGTIELRETIAQL